MSTIEFLLKSCGSMTLFMYSESKQSDSLHEVILSRSKSVVKYCLGIGSGVKMLSIELGDTVRTPLMTCSSSFSSSSISRCLISLSFAAVS